MKPSIWNSSPKHSSKEKLIESYLKDNTINSKYNNLIPIKNPKHIRLMNYNICLWNTIYEKDNLYEISKIIIDTNPDIIILTEVLWSDNLELFKKKLDKQYNFIPHKCKKNRICPICTLIISKYKILDVNSYPLNKNEIDDCDIECQSIIHAIIELPTKNIDIFAIHLDVYDETENTRYNQMVNLLETIHKYKQNNSIMIIGDYNSLYRDNYNKKELKWLEENNLHREIPIKTQYKAIDYLVSQNYYNCDLDNENKYTVWSGRTVDYMFVNDTFEYHIDNIYRYFSNASDHLPIILDIF